LTDPDLIYDRLNFSNVATSKENMRTDHLTRSVIASGLLVLMFCASAQAEKQSRHDARTDRLRGLNTLEILLLAPYLEKGPVGLVEFADDDRDELPAVNLASIVNASVPDIVDVITHPSAYPKFMKTIDDVEVVDTQGSTSVYDWSWRLSVFQLRGRNTMTVYAPPAGGSNTGYRVTIDSNYGDLGQGRVLMKVIPLAPSKSLLVVSVRLDMRKANYLVRELAVASTSINRSANILLSCSTLFSLQREVERRAGYTRKETSEFKFGKPQLAINKMFPLFGRGDLLLFDMQGYRLNQITVVGRISLGPVPVKELMQNIHAFSVSLVPGSFVELVSNENGKADFDWGIDLPFVDVSGRMRLHLEDEDKVVAVDAISGALNGGRWRFEANEVSKNSSVVVGWTSFDMKNSTWLLQYLISVDPYLGHGLSAAADIMLIRSLRSRAEKTIEMLKAQAHQAAKTPAAKTPETKK
jgi:hypothetical protein